MQTFTAYMTEKLSVKALVFVCYAQQEHLKMEWAPRIASTARLTHIVLELLTHQLTVFVMLGMKAALSVSEHPVRLVLPAHKESIKGLLAQVCANPAH